MDHRLMVALKRKRYEVGRKLQQLALFERTNAPGSWNIAAWHWNWSLSWRWVLGWDHPCRARRVGKRWGFFFMRTFCGRGFMLVLGLGPLGRVRLYAQPNVPRRVES